MATGAGPRLGSPAQWCIVLLLAVIAAALAAALAQPAERYGAAPAGGGAECVTVGGPIGPDSQGLWVVDPAGRTIALYEYVPDDRLLKPRAARSYRFDRQLDAWQTDPPPGQAR